MSYLNHMTSSNQAMVLGRSNEERVELLQHALQSDVAEADELRSTIERFRRAGLRADALMRDRLTGLERTIEQTRQTLANVEQTVAA